MAHSFRGRNYGYNRYARYQFLNEFEKGRRSLSNSSEQNPDQIVWGCVLPVFGFLLLIAILLAH